MVERAVCVTSHGMDAATITGGSIGGAALLLVTWVAWNYCRRSDCAMRFGPWRLRGHLEPAGRERAEVNFAIHRGPSVPGESSPPHPRAIPSAAAAAPPVIAAAEVVASR
jgi:hypothetical protein